MFHYGKAYSIVVFVTGGLVSYLTDIYWLLERNLPDLLARLFSDEAESNLDEQSTNTSHFHKPLPPGASFPNQPRTYLPVSHVRDLHRSEQLLVPGTRSFKTPRSENNKPPHASYKKGEEVWLTIEGQYGAFKVIIDSEGWWDEAEEQWKYLVRQTDGLLYGQGKLVAEKDLDRSKDY